MPVVVVINVDSLRALDVFRFRVCGEGGGAWGGKGVYIPHGAARAASVADLSTLDAQLLNKELQEAQGTSQRL